MSATFQSLAAGTVATGVGSMSVLLGDMAGLNLPQWMLLFGVVVLSIMAGGLAALGQIEANPQTTDAAKRAARVRAVTVLAAQILIGMVVAAQAGGNIWIIIPACLAIGWTGSAFLKRLAEKSGLTPDE